MTPLLPELPYLADYVYVRQREFIYSTIPTIRHPFEPLMTHTLFAGEIVTHTLVLCSN